MSAIAQPQPRSDDSVHEFGRDFLSFSVQHGIYCVPIDEKLTAEKEEINRQADFCDIISRLFEGRTFLPINVTPEFVLDCGSGCGVEWAEEVMEKSEMGSASSSSGDDDFACQVVAVDLYHTIGSSPGVIKKRWNLNEAFRYGQAELARDKYDLVNSRFLADGINADRWASYVQDLHGRLRRNGWLQMIEAQFHIQSNNGRSLEHLSRWWNIYSNALERQRKDPRAGVDLSRHMVNAGFVNISFEPKQLPIGEWPQDPRLREIGRDMKPIAVQTLKSLGVYHCRNSGMSESDFEQLIAGCEREIFDTSLRLYIPLFAVWGQRTDSEQRHTEDGATRYNPHSNRRLPPPVDWA
ncbi:hypothetical protein E4T43_04486 [Aureobasidium subglaciale]|nr:hypothetical protein E4T43_04486 [Aureobasidium subglaciale]